MTTAIAPEKFESLDFEAIALAGLLPALARRKDFSGATLTDQGFGDTPAGVQLSRQLSVLFLQRDEFADTSAHAPRAFVSHRTISGFGLSTRQAWNLAAANLHRRALTAQGLRFRTRCAAEILPGCEEGIQIQARGAEASAWLAHPQTFSIMDSHLRRLTHATARQTLYYLVPDPATVVALHDSPLKRVRHWSRRLNEQRRLRGAVLAPEPLLWANGFPLEA